MLRRDFDWALHSLSSRHVHSHVASCAFSNLREGFHACIVAFICQVARAFPYNMAFVLSFLGSLPCSVAPIFRSMQGPPGTWAALVALGVAFAISFGLRLCSIFWVLLGCIRHLLIRSRGGRTCYWGTLGLQRWLTDCLLRWLAGGSTPLTSYASLPEELLLIHCCF